NLAIILIFIASQIFWIGRVIDFESRFITGKTRRVWLAVITVVVFSFVFLYSYSEWGLSAGHIIWAADYRPLSVIIHAAFWWWFVGAMSAFLLVIVFGVANRAVRAVWWVYRRARSSTRRHTAAPDTETTLLSASRRRFLEQTAVLVSATPFLATGYGLLYER